LTNLFLFGKILIKANKMARIIKEIEIEGKKVNALFDTGAFYTYVRKRLLNDRTVKRKVKKPFSVGLGGKKIIVNELCLISGEIEDLPFDTSAVPVRKIGKVNEIKTEIDILIGALTMEQWAIILDPRTGKLDLEGLRRREFTEFFEQIINTIKIL